VKTSTKWLFKKHGWRLDRTLHNYIYYRFYYPYVKVLYRFVQGLGYAAWFRPLAPLGRMIFNRYHAKVLSFSDTRKIFSLNEDVHLVSDDNKKIIPYKYATKILFSEPTHIAVMDCPCKLATRAPAEDIASCLAVGKQLTEFWLDHCQNYHPRKITQAEAMDLVCRFRQKGHINQAFLKVATGGCTGVICNCHPETCVSLKATKAASRIDKNLSMSAESGYSVSHNPALCTHCGTCEAVCHFGAVQFVNGSRVYDRSKCLGCDLCVGRCPEGALSLYSDPDKSLPMDLDMLQTAAKRAGCN